MTIKEMIEFIRQEESKPDEYRSEASKKAVEEYRQYLYDHYTTKYIRYKEKNNDVNDIDELYPKAIKRLCDNYINYGYSFSLSDYINNYMKRKTKSKHWDLKKRYVRPAPVRELVTEARSGNETSKEKLIEHYKEHYSYFIDENPNIENIEKKYAKYIELLVPYYIEHGTDKMSDLIKNKLEIATKNKKWDIENVEEFFHPVSDLIDKSKSGSLEAKQKLIERYMYIVDKNIQKYPNIIEVEEAIQIGYLYLSQKVNDYINGESEIQISTYIESAFNNWFVELLKQQKSQNQIQEEIKAKNSLVVTPTDDFELNRIYFEALNCLQSNGVQERDIWVFKEMLTGRTQTDIARDLCVSRNMVNIISNRNRKVLKKVNNNN